MTWTYTISPFLYGLPGTTSRAFTSDELKLAFLLYENTTVTVAASASATSDMIKVSAPALTPSITV